MYEQMKERITKNLTFIRSLNEELYQTIVEKRPWENPIEMVPHGEDIDIFYYDEVLRDVKRNSLEHAKNFMENIQYLYFNPRDKRVEHLKEKYKDWEKSHTETIDEHFQNAIDSFIIFGLAPFFHIERIIGSLIEAKWKRLKEIVLIEFNVDFVFIFLMLCDLEKLLAKAKSAGITFRFLVPDTDDKVYASFLKFFQEIGTTDVKIFGYYRSYKSHKMTSYIQKLRDFLLSNYIYVNPKLYIESLSNIIENMANEELNFFGSLKPLSIDTPVLIVGSGPSLEKDLEWIKRNREKLYIVSLTSTAKILLKNGIAPDVVFIIDPLIGKGEGLIDEFEGVDISQLTFVASIESNASLLHLAKKSFIACSAFHHSLFRGAQRFNNSPTVFTYALEFVLKMGFRRIILSGVDLGTKRKEVIYHKDYGEAEESEVLDMVYEGNFGGKVYTKADYLFSKYVAEYTIAPYSGEFFNLSDGIKIEGFRSAKHEQLEPLLQTPKEDLVHLMEKETSMRWKIQKRILEENETFDSVLVKRMERLRKSFSQVQRFIVAVERIVTMPKAFQKATEVNIFRAFKLFLLLKYLIVLDKVVQDNEFMKGILSEEAVTLSSEIEEVQSCIEENKKKYKVLKKYC